MSMNLDFLWLTGALQLLVLFVVGPVIAIAIAYAAWRQKPQNFNPKRYGMSCVASGVIASLLLGVAKWINADVRTAQYFLQLACVLSGGLLLGVGVGALIPVLLHVWRWHKTTSLADPNQTE
ncbi:MAG TPA: hypothetical protein VFA40_03590 [Terriglobales bacterium]|nr:hypothetical protein [Terriglobales bacterium]